MSDGVATPKSKSVPVAPNSVRVWTGFRLAELEPGIFFKKLGEIFCPATVQIQAPVGLTAYLPSVLPADKHPAAPDEIAVVFYREGETEEENTYHLAKKTVGGRAYSDLHALVFDLERCVSGFPDPFKGEAEPNGRYYLFNERVDWQHGIVNVFVGVRPDNDTEDAFLSNVAQWLKDVQGRGGPDGAIAATAPDFVVFWEHWPRETDAENSQIAGLAQLSKTVYHQRIDSYALPEGLWASYDGVKVKGGESFNFQFDRHF
jgi:hypothetical protein